MNMSIGVRRFRYPIRDAYGEIEFPETDPLNSAKPLPIPEAK
jgi:hypothetical protein